MSSKFYKPFKKRSRILAHGDPLDKMKVLPKTLDVVQRYKKLQKENNGTSKANVVGMVADELIVCWQGQDIPTRQRQGIVTKLNRTLLKKCKPIDIPMFKSL